MGIFSDAASRGEARWNAANQSANQGTNQQDPSTGLPSANTNGTGRGPFSDAADRGEERRGTFSSTSSSTTSSNAIKNAIAAAKQAATKAGNEVYSFLQGTDEAAQNNWLNDLNRQNDEQQANIASLNARLDEIKEADSNTPFSEKIKSLITGEKSEAAKARDEEKGNLQKALEQALEENKLTKSKLDVAQQAYEKRTIRSSVEAAREGAASYTDLIKDYSQSLDKLNKDRATAIEDLNRIRNGAGYYGAASTYEEDKARQEADEKDALARLEAAEKQIQRVTGMRNYAFARSANDKGADAIIRQGEELANIAKEQFIKDNRPDPTTNADYRTWVDSNPGKTAKDYAEQQYADREPNDLWTQEEKNLYYILMTDSPERAYQYAVGVNSAINREVNERTVSSITDFFPNYDLSKEAREGRSGAANALMTLGNEMSDAAGIVGGVATAPTKLFNWLDNIYQNNERDGYYAGNNTPRISDYTDKLLNQNAERLNSYGTIRDDVPILGGKGLGDLYQLVESVAQSMAYGGGLSKAFGVGATTAAGLKAAQQAAKLSTGLIFFGQAADSSYNEYIQRGMSREQAAVGSFFAGLAEAMGEELSIDHLISGDISEGLAKYVAKQSFIEASEEGFTNVLNLFGDELAARMTGGESKMRQDIEALKRSGMSEEDAKRQVWKEFVDGTVFDMLGGAISGGLSSGAYAAPNALYNYVQNRNNRNQQNATTSAQPAAQTQGEQSQGPKISNPLYDAFNAQTQQTQPAQAGQMPAAEAATVAENATTEEPAQATQPTAETPQAPTVETTTSTAEAATQPQAAEATEVAQETATEPEPATTAEPENRFQATPEAIARAQNLPDDVRESLLAEFAAAQQDLQNNPELANDADFLQRLNDIFTRANQAINEANAAAASAESAPTAEPSPAPAPAPAPATTSTGTDQSAGTIHASEQTTAERTNGMGNERERNMSRNLRDNEKAEPDLRNSFEENRDLYTQLTNAEVAAKAAEIVGKGYDAAKNDIYEKIGQAKAGAKLAPEYAVAGYQLANEMVRRHETEAARELCADIAAELTYAGQVGQIGRLILAADPSIRIRTVERLVKKLNDGLSNRQKAKNVENGVGTETGNIKVSDEALQEYAAAETDEAANKALDAIEQEIADQIPATFRDKFTALRYLNMLGNLKTQGRNIVGNAAMMTATNVKYLTQHVMELARAAATGGDYQVNTALNTSKELRQQAAADFEANIDEIKGETKYADVSRQAAKGIQDKRTIFGSGESSKWASELASKALKRDVDVKKNVLENARKVTNWAMDAGDEIFLRQVYVRSFAGWMKAHGVTDVNSASPEQVSAAREFAKKEAQEATFHDSNKVSDWVSSLGRGQNTPKVIKMISEGIVPFRKTPANVAVRAIEYSPAGAVVTLYEAIQAKKGNASAADVINSAAKNLTGTALFGIGMLMAAAGRARASGDDEDEKLNNFKKLHGEMDYSVKVGDKYISLSQLAPMAIPFFMGVKLNELLEYSDNLFSADSIGDILGVVSEPMLEMSMLSGVNDFLNDLSSVSGDTDALPSLIGNAALSYLSQGLTNSLLGQFEQASERNRQTTYSDTKSADATGFDRFLGKNQYKIGKYSAKIPGIDYNQQDYVDAWGRTQSNGGVGERAFNAFLNPTYTGKDRSTDVDEELERLYRDNKGKDDFPDVFPQKRSRSDVIGDGVVMTPDEYLAFSQESGQKKLELVREFIQSADYKNLTDEQRAETIHNLYAFADATALQKVRDANGVEKQSDYAKLITGVKRAGDDIPALDEKNVGEYIAYDTALKTAVENGDYASIDNLLTRYSKLNQNTQDVLSVKNPAGMNNLLKYVNAGSSAESYFKLKEAIGDVQDMEDTSSENARIKFNALVNADIPDKEKAELVESGAFDVAKSVRTSVGAFSKAGYGIEDAYNFYMKADSTNGKSDGEVSQGELVTALEKDAGMSQPQKNAIYEYYMQQNGWKTGYDAALKNAKKSGKKYGVA